MLSLRLRVGGFKSQLSVIGCQFWNRHCDEVRRSSLLIGCQFSVVSIPFLSYDRDINPTRRFCFLAKAIHHSSYFLPLVSKLISTLLFL